MTIFDTRPSYSLDEAQQIATRYFGLAGSCVELPSERDQNFLIDDPSHLKWVLKIANAEEADSFIDAQNHVLHRLEKTGQPYWPSLKKPLDSDNDVLRIQNASGLTHLVRAVRYLEGTPLADVASVSSALLVSLGGAIGELDRTLADYDHPVLHRTFQWDLAQAPSIIQQYRHLIKDPILTAAIDDFLTLYEQRVVPHLAHLRQSVIHNDANDYNIIVRQCDQQTSPKQQLAGIIDLGDLTYSYTVCDLAITIAYAILEQPAPLVTARAIIQGYHQHYPLTEEELSVLFPLIGLRLCASACIAAHQQQQAPDNDYLGISQQPIRHTLPRLCAISPHFAEGVFRQECGLAPFPSTDTVLSTLAQQTPYPILGTPLNTDNAIALDLGVASPFYSLNPAENAEPELTRSVKQFLQSHKKTYGIGLHDEARLIYTSDAFADSDDLLAERRTVHLGIDLFAPPETTLYTPIAATVEALHNNAQWLDYGPVVILRHEDTTGQPFYSLYGHLTADTIAQLHVGQSLQAGEAFARIGRADVNGGWTPHVHVQLITDLLDLGTDFPGVAKASERQLWSALSPSPAVLLGLPSDLLPTTRSKSETLARRQHLLGGNLSIGYNEPVKIVRGYMQYLYDETGRRYLDAYNNVPHVGHCHPEIVRAGQTQMHILNTNTRYLHDHILDYAEALTATLPTPLSVCYFLSSASEANELALRMARAYTHQQDVIVLDAAYHGHTTTLVDISPYKNQGPGGQGQPDWVHIAPIPDTYRGAIKADNPNAGALYAEGVADITQQLQRVGKGVSAFIAESCPSVGGQIIPPQGYLRHVYQHIRAAGGLCIADEVQTGYGRTGHSFYAFEQQGVIPDIIILGKPIGNGHPIGALITTPDIAAAFDNGMEFFATFGGNTVSSYIGKAVLDLTLKENHQQHARCIGEYLLTALEALKQRFDIIGDVRGAGLFLGVELVKDRTTLEPAAEAASFVVNRMREHGVLMGTDGPLHNVIKIRPPMAITQADAEVLVQCLTAVFEAHFTNA